MILHRIKIEPMSLHHQLMIQIPYLCDHVESEVEYLLCDVHSASEEKE